MFLHWHKFEVRGVHMMQRVVYGPLGEMASPITEVLLVCVKCGWMVTRELDGHWTLEQLQQGAKDGDADFFRKMGVKL